MSNNQEEDFLEDKYKTLLDYNKNYFQKDGNENVEMGYICGYEDEKVDEKGNKTITKCTMWYK